MFNIVIYRVNLGSNGMFYNLNGTESKVFVLKSKVVKHKQEEFSGRAIHICSVNLRTHFNHYLINTEYMHYTYICRMKILSNFKIGSPSFIIHEPGLAAVSGVYTHKIFTNTFHKRCTKYCSKKISDYTVIQSFSGRLPTKNANYHMRI